jgi:mRNA interferase RelE/StbE
MTNTKFELAINRIGMTVDSKNKQIICQRVVHRREIYRVFP